ncbi:MAG: glycoside hydrolase family 127 protein, partial [Candidatus Omnitrophica bacterium]|nr:glycoside hydrolase family 127 protein [Candidatus Omnitrophota bacterium]
MHRFSIAFLIPIFLSPAFCQYSHIPPGNIGIGGEIGDRIDRTIENNLMVLDLDNDFLQPFRDKKSSGGFIGLGMLIDSAVKLAAYSGEEEVIGRKDYLIDEALKTQEADGYLGMMKPESRLWSLWDIHEMSYLIAGLVTDYRLFGNERSLVAAKKIADYIIEGWSASPEKKPGDGAITVYMAVTGSETAMLDLYDLTDEKRYLDYCTELRNLDEWDGPIVLGRWGPIQGHAYAYMSRCLAQIHLDQIQPSQNLVNPTRKVLHFLTEENGLVISGECGDHECWHNTQEGTTNLGETCATAYLTRLLDRLYLTDPAPLWGDLMERSIHNGLFGAQSPDGRKIRYYTPYEVPRVYFDRDTYCCPCNFRRIMGELPNMVYYQTENGVLANLYTPSEATLELKDGSAVRLRQSTDYPTSGKIEFEVGLDQPETFEFAFRIPRWCEDASLIINGE